MLKFLIRLLLLFFFGVLLIHTSAQANETVDNVVYGVATTALLVDWRQTRWLTENYDKGYYETNPYLGKQPSKSDVDKYFAGLLLLQTGLNLYGNRHVRFNTNMSVLFTHGMSAYKNRSIGVKLQFNF